MHPDHKVYDGTSVTEHCKGGVPTSGTVFDQCVAVPKGSGWLFTFGKAGTWKYHNHASATDFGSVIVTTSDALPI